MAVQDEDVTGTTLPGEAATPSKEELDKADQLRRVAADVYTFVRSREINKAISSFTLDHYIEEAKRAIRSPRIVRSASGEQVDERPSKLDEIQKMEDYFNQVFGQLERLTKKLDAETETEGSS